MVHERHGPTWTPEQQAAYNEGSAQLYAAQQGEVVAQLQKFEARALEVYLHVPAGLLAVAVGGQCLVEKGTNSSSALQAISCKCSMAWCTAESVPEPLRSAVHVAGSIAALFTAAGRHGGS
jgi:hypothetical protein